MAAWRSGRFFVTLLYKIIAYEAAVIDHNVYY
jgi:hypothetical protein